MPLRADSGDGAFPAPLSEAVVEQLTAIYREKQSWTPAQKKVDSCLLVACKCSRNEPVDSRVVRSLSSLVDIDRQGMVEVKIKCSVSEALIGVIEDLGGAVQRAYPQYGTILARVPLRQLDALAAQEAITSIRRPDGWIAQGLTTSEAVIGHEVDRAWEDYGLDGSGLILAVLSNGIDRLPDVQASGDLPEAVTILPGQQGMGNEGTPMLEIIHDLAPKATLMFSTALGGQEQMAANILALAAAGADVIVDDVSYLAEAAFQAGIITQAIADAVTDYGVTYVAAVGNKGNRSANTASVWEGDYTPSGTTFSYPISPENPDKQGFGVLHNFAPSGDDPDVSNDVLSDSPFPTVLQWADLGGFSSNDFDLVLLHRDGTVSGSFSSQDGDDDPIEIGPPVKAGDLIMIVNFEGRADPRFLRVDTFGSGTFREGLARPVLEYGTNGAIAGHAGAREVIAVGAVNIAKAHVGGVSGVFDEADFSGTSDVEPFTSDGPRRVFYRPDGTPITPGNFTSTGGLVRPKPDLVAADGVSTTTPGFSSFSGTSSAAPHAAAVAALVLQANPELTPGQVKSIMYSSTLDIEAAGYDDVSGFGVVNAYKAIDNLMRYTSINGAFQVDGYQTAFSEEDIRWVSGLLPVSTIFTNTTENRFADVFFEVDTLTGGNVLLGAVGDGGEGSRLAGPTTVEPGESFTTVFNIGLAERRPFRFEVNVYGIAENEHAGACIDLSPAQRQRLLVDRFHDSPGPAGDFTPTTQALGGERDFTSQVSGSDATGDFDYTGDSLRARFAYRGFGFGGFDLTYDGVDGSHDRDFRGLGGVDVTDQGEHDEFYATLNDVQGPWLLQVVVHTDQETAFRVEQQLPEEGPFPRDVVIPLDRFSPTGNPRWDDVGLVDISFRNSPDAGDTEAGVEVLRVGFRSSEARKVKVPITSSLSLQANDVSVPFGADGQPVLSQVRLTGQGSGWATLHTFERDPSLVRSGDPLSLRVTMDLTYQVTFVDDDPVQDYDPYRGSSVALTDQASSLRTSYLGVADLEKPNYGLLPQVTSWSWGRDNTALLAPGWDLNIPDTRVQCSSTGQGWVEDEMPETPWRDDWDCVERSTWRLFAGAREIPVAANGTLSIQESEVIPPRLR